MHNGLTRKARGFTLLELLITIAIISALMGILVPSLSAAREAARQTNCLANLHSIGIASLSYFDSERFPPYFFDGITLYGLSYSLSWSDFLVKLHHISSEVNADAIPHPIGDGGLPGVYLSGMISQRDRVFQCPSQVERLFDTVEGQPVSYRADYLITGHVASAPVSGIYTSPSYYQDARLIWMGEAFTTHGALSAREYVRQTQLGIDENDVNPLRHRGYSTYLFGDSHAEASRTYHTADWSNLQFPWEPVR